MTFIRRSPTVAIWGAVLWGLTACRPGDVLDVPPPTGQIAYSGLQGAGAAAAAFVGAAGQFFTSFEGETGDYGQPGGLAELSGVLTDEFTCVDVSEYYGIGCAEFNARFTVVPVQNPNNFGELGDYPLVDALQARQTLQLAIGFLKQYESGSGRSAVGEAYALVGYTELLLAEEYCAGVTLSNVMADGGWSYSTPLSTVALLDTAENDFKAALANANSNDTVTSLASTGLGRTLLDRGGASDYDSAASYVSTVPASFIYNAQLAPTGQTGSPNYAYANLTGYGYCGNESVGNSEGGNGLDFVSAVDPRLVLDPSLEETCDGTNQLADSVLNYPLKFGNPVTGLLPLATGIEAQLIIAEAALHDGNTALWLTTLNTLRNGGSTCTANATCPLGTGQVAAQTTGLVSLTDPGTDSLRVALTFQERAFWLFGTGTRLGDLRRLIRNYGWSPNGVFPTGVYQGGSVPAVPLYGSDVAMTLPTPQSGVVTGNPNYRGCIVPTTTA